MRGILKYLTIHKILRIGSAVWCFFLSQLVEKQSWERREVPLPQNHNTFSWTLDMPKYKQCFLSFACPFFNVNLYYIFFSYYFINKGFTYFFTYIFLFNYKARDNTNKKITIYYVVWTHLTRVGCYCYCSIFIIFFCLGPLQQGGELFELYASICHTGSPSGGHYTAYAKHPLSTSWHYFNDSQVMSRVMNPYWFFNLWGGVLFYIF